MVRKIHKIRICFFSPAAYPVFKELKNEVFGGAELQLSMLAKKMATNDNYEVDFIVGDYGQPKTEYHENIRLIKSFKQVQNERLLNKFIKSVKYFMILIRVKPDIIITTAAHATVGLTAFYSRLFSKKHIHRTAHVDDVNFNWINKNGIIGKIYKFGLKNADILVTQNIEHKALLLKNHKIEAKLLRNAFPVLSSPETKKDGVLWVGRFVNWKRPELYLKLAKKFPDIKFVMICSYSDKNYDDWRLFREKAKSLNNVKFIYNIPFAEVQVYFNSAEIFVNTSDAEGFPNTFLQAAVAKTPIVSLNVNPDNFITNYDTGYCCNNSFNVMIEKIRHLLSNKEDMQQKASNIRQYLVNNHDLNKIIIQFEKLLTV